MKWWLSQKCLIWFHYFADWKGSQIQECITCSTSRMQLISFHACPHSLLPDLLLTLCQAPEPSAIPWGVLLLRTWIWQLIEVSASGLLPQEICFYPPLSVFLLKETQLYRTGLILGPEIFSSWCYLFYFHFCCCCLVTTLYPTILRPL